MWEVSPTLNLGTLNLQQATDARLGLLSQDVAQLYTKQNVSKDHRFPIWCTGMAAGFSPRNLAATPDLFPCMFAAPS